MDILRLLVNVILIIFLLNIVVFGYQYFQSSYYQETQNYKYNPEKMNISENLTENSRQYYPNMRFNTNNISYFIHDDCSSDKIKGVLEAFDILADKTEVVDFYPTTEDKAKILISCSDVVYKEEKSIVAGEGGPVNIVNSSYYPAITRGKIVIYKPDSCSMPITELHELMHVFGFDHVNDSGKIMYPYLNCKQEINQEIINKIIELYSVQPAAELYFKDISASKTGYYLNFTVEIINDGLVDADNVVLEVIDNGKKIDNFDLKDIPFGSSKIFYVSNLRLSSKNTEKLEFNIVFDGSEFDKKNNKIEIGF